MIIYERLTYLFDKGSAIVKLHSKSGFLLGSGDINGFKSYFIAFKTDQKPQSIFEDFQYLNSFFDHIYADPAPLILMMDVPSSHQAAQKSSFPDDAEYLLASKEGVASWYYHHAKLSGKIPQICAVFDKMGASLTFPISLSDAVVMTESAGMSIGRLDVVNKMLHQDIKYDDLGGAKLHATISGSIDSIEKDEIDVMHYIRKYLSYFPKRSKEKLPKHEFTYTKKDSIETLIPKDALSVLDIDKLIENIVDDESFFELRKSFAKEIVTAFATFNGNIAGIIANRSSYKSGLFFPQTSLKASRFISLCDSFGIPLVFLSDSAGFMVGEEVEKGGNIKSAAQLFSTIANARTAKISVIIRRAYTAGLYAMGGAGMMPDKFIALPSAIISIYGESVARELMRSSSLQEREKAMKMLESASDPQYYLKRNLLDGIIDYENLRDEIIAFVSQYQDGQRASSNPVQII